MKDKKLKSKGPPVYSKAELWAPRYVGVIPRYVGVIPLIRKFEADTLGSEMRFMGTFLEYAAPICIECECLKPLLQRAHDLYFQALFFHIEFLVLKNGPGNSNSDNDYEMLIEWATPAAYTLHEVMLLNVEITQVYNILSPRLILISPPISSYNRLINFFNSLLLNIKVLWDSRVVYVKGDLLRIQLKALEEKFLFFRNFLMFVTVRCSDEKQKLTDDLFNYATFLAYNIAYLYHSCFVTRDRLELMDEEGDMRPDRLASRLSELASKMDPAASSHAREVYIAALEACSEYLSSPSPDFDASWSNMIADSFIKSLLENVKQLSCAAGWTLGVRDPIQTLSEALAFLRSFFMQPPHPHVDSATLSSLLLRSKIICIKAGSIVYALLDKKVNEESPEKVVSSSLANLLKELGHLKAEIKAVSERFVSEKFLAVQFPKFPRCDELGCLDRFLQNLRDLLNSKSSSTTCFNLPIDALLEYLQIIRSFLSEIAQQNHKHLWTRIMEVTCKAEYIVDLILLTSFIIG